MKCALVQCSVCFSSPQWIYLKKKINKKEGKKEVLIPDILFSAVVFKTTECQLGVEEAALSSKAQL